MQDPEARLLHVSMLRNKFRSFSSQIDNMNSRILICPTTRDSTVMITHKSATAIRCISSVHLPNGYSQFIVIPLIPIQNA